MCVLYISVNKFVWYQHKFCRNILFCPIIVKLWSVYLQSIYALWTKKPIFSFILLRLYIYFTTFGKAFLPIGYSVFMTLGLFFVFLGFPVQLDQHNSNSHFGMWDCLSQGMSHILWLYNVIIINQLANIIYSYFW